MSRTTKVDRASLVRRALVELVAERGFRGASMASVAERAGVATGTAYVHYASKDDLVLAAYCEVKAELGEAAASVLDPAAPAEQRFALMWHAIHDHLAADPVRAAFLAQVDASPYAAPAHEAALDGDDTALLDAVAGDIAARFVDLPLRVLWELAVGPVIRLVAAGEELDERELSVLALACWRAITNE